MAKNIADALGVTLDYLLGDASKAVLDKDLLKRLEDIENLSQEDKDKIYYFIDMAVRDAKARQSYGSWDLFVNKNIKAIDLINRALIVNIFIYYFLNLKLDFIYFSFYLI